MEETAKTYYNNLAEEEKYKAKEMFVSMDLNGDGGVSVSECVTALGEMGFMSCHNKTFFTKLDKNGDGMLDFDEFLSLYYLYRSGKLVFCDGHGCGAFLKGIIYYTCVDCFSTKSNTFNLCSFCFHSNNYDFRKHTTLMDNSMIGSSKKVKPYSHLEEASGRLSYAPYYGSPKKSSSSSSHEKNTIEEAAEAFETGVEIGELVAECCECSIM